MQATELVKSLSIGNLVNQRAAVIERLDKAVSLIREAAEIAAVAHLGMPRLMISTGFGRGHGSGERAVADARVGTRRDGSAWEQEGADRGDVDRTVRLGVDAAAWQYLMHESGLRSLMDAKTPGGVEADQRIGSARRQQSRQPVGEPCSQCARRTCAHRHGSRPQARSSLMADDSIVFLRHRSTRLTRKPAPIASAQQRAAVSCAQGRPDQAPPARAAQLERSS